MDLTSKFNAGEFAILAEIEPPKGVAVDTMVKNARRVKGVVDAFMVPEMSNAVMRMSALGGAMILQNNGMDTIMQINCRDRNRIALQADLLAAAASGIKNIMAVTGEDPSFGDHHQARSVYDIDLLELLNVIVSLQNGRDMAGIDLVGTPKFLVGSFVNAGTEGRSYELEMTEMRKKVAAGARFMVTPPLFDLSVIRSFLSKVDQSQVKIIPTVLLLKSLGMARYMARNVQNVHIPDALIDRIRKAPDKVSECTKIASETVAALKNEGFSGVLLSTIGWEDKLPDIIEKI